MMLAPILALSTAIVAFVTFPSAIASDDPPSSADRSISLVAVRALDAAEWNLLGHVVAIHSARIGARVSGRIETFGKDDSGRTLDVGSHFSEGAELFTLDRDALSAAVRAAQASEARARAALADLLAGTRPERIAGLVAGVADVTARLDEAKADLERYRRLVLEDKTAAPKKLEEAQTRVRVLEAERDRAQASLDEARAGATPTAIELAKAAVAEAEARTHMAQIDLDDAVVRAPFSGTVTQKNRGIGDYVTPAPFIEVLEFISTDDLEVEADIVESLFAQIVESETQIEIHTDLLTKPLTTVISRRVGAVDPATGTFRIRAAIPREAAIRLAPGAFLRLTLATDSRAKRLLIPNSAVMSESDGKYVFVAKDGVMRRTRVEISDTLSEGAIVKSGLAASDRVVIGPRGSLADGKSIPNNP